MAPFLLCSMIHIFPIIVIIHEVLHNSASPTLAHAGSFSRADFTGASDRASDDLVRCFPQAELSFKCLARMEICEDSKEKQKSHVHFALKLHFL